MKEINIEELFARLEKEEKERQNLISNQIRKGCEKCSQWDSYWGCDRCERI